MLGNWKLFPPETIIFVGPKVEPTNESFIVALNKEGDVIFKQLIIDAGIKYLKSLNPDYSQIQIGNNWSICATFVVALIK